MFGTDPSDDPSDSNAIRWVTFVGEGLGAPRDRSCARREAWGRMSFRAVREGWV